MEQTQFCKMCKTRNTPPRCPGFLIGWGILKECPYDHNTDLITYNISDDDLLTICDISEDSEFINAMIKLKEKDPIEYQLKMSQFKATIVQQQTTEEKISNNTVKCPRCGSTNIQIVPRKWSLLTGFLTNKTDRVCVNCKHKF